MKEKQSIIVGRMMRSERARKAMVNIFRHAASGKRPDDWECKLADVLTKGTKKHAAGLLLPRVASDDKPELLARQENAKPWLGANCFDCSKSQVCKQQDKIFQGQYKELPDIFQNRKVE